MHAGREFTSGQARDIERALRGACQDAGLVFSVWVGDSGSHENSTVAVAGAARNVPSSRDRARQLHAALGREASNAVLIAVDPIARWLEIVTGDEARRRLDDQTCALVAISMTSAFSTGDLLGGITSGISMLSENADPTRHTPPSEQEPG